MPRRRKRKTSDELKSKVQEIIESGSVILATNIIDELPPREKVRDVLSKPPFEIINREFRVILVEDLGDYKVYIQIPGKKDEYDFFVWRGIFKEDRLIDLKIPTHDDLGKMFLNLKQRSPILDEYLINATIRFIRDRMSIEKIIKRYFSKCSDSIILELKKFLATLKWIALQEDVNYPPPNLGSLYTLSVYALLEIFGDLKVIRKVIRWRGK